MSEQLQAEAFNCEAVHGRQLTCHSRNIDIRGYIEHAATRQATRVVMLIGATIITSRAVTIGELDRETTADQCFQ